MNRTATHKQIPPDSGAPRRMQAAAVLRLLRAEYGSGRRHERSNPTDSLIATILSQHTADRNSGVAFTQLKERYGTWADITDANVNELAAVIRPAGLGNIKAARIQSVLHELNRRHGSMDLAFLNDLPLMQAREMLRTLPGVGPKTAACVLLFACDLPALPVDTHVHRVTKRLGLIGATDSAERAHDALEALVPAEDVYDFHVTVIAHGRQVCQARRPRCEMCVLQKHCDYWLQVRPH